MIQRYDWPRYICLKEIAWESGLFFLGMENNDDRMIKYFSFFLFRLVFFFVTSELNTDIMTDVLSDTGI